MYARTSPGPEKQLYNNVHFFLRGSAWGPRALGEYQKGYVLDTLGPILNFPFRYHKIKSELKSYKKTLNKTL